MKALATTSRVLPFLLVSSTMLSGCRDRVVPAPASDGKGGTAPSRDETPGARPTTPGQLELTDISGSLEAIRSDFNAHKDQNRFLTLLAPT